MRTYATGKPRPAQVTHICDGDTLDVMWHGPYSTNPEGERIRLAGLETPELYPRPQPGSEAARSALKKLALHKHALVVPVHKHPDCYGRYIARVYVQPDGRLPKDPETACDITLLMIMAGYGWPWLDKKHRAVITTTRPRTGVPAADATTLGNQNAQPTTKESQCAAPNAEASSGQPHGAA